MLLKRAEQIDNQPGDEMDLPAELERREQRLEELAAAKARIEERARARDAEEQAEYEAKCAKREALRKEGKKPKGKDPEPPTAGPRDKDQVNLTDEESRIMKASGGGFVQGYNAQAAVDLDTMLIVSAKVTQDCNDKKQIEPMLAEIKNLPEDLGEVTGLLADTGYFSEKNVNHCDNHSVTPMIAMKRDHHNMPLRERFAEDAPCPEATDSVSQMAWRLKTKAGRALYALRKSTVEPVFGIVKNVMGFRQFSMRGLKEANGEWNLVAIAWNLKRMNVLKMV